jgi:hypothetical protein
MPRTIASLTIACALLLALGSVEVRGQVPCTFAGDFAAFRDVVGPQTVGTCLEDEHVNETNGNTEQRTSGGLFVRRAEGTITAFTDGVTTWLNGPNGLEIRPNGQQLPWEVELAAALPSLLVDGSAPSPSPSPLVSPSPLPASLAALPGADMLPPPPGPVASATVGAAATATRPTRTPTPKPAVTVKLREKPDSVDTGHDVRFEVETNVKKGNCSLTLEYRNSDPVPVAGGEIDDERCEMEYTIPKDTRTGKATAKITVAAPEGVATVEDEFDVNQGDSVLGGDMDIELDGIDLPDEVDVGDSFRVAVDTNLNDKGKCEMSIAWPRYTTYGAEPQTPDSRGRCSWRVTVPTEIPKKGKATLTVVVRKNNKKNSSEVRTLTKDIDVRK